MSGYGFAYRGYQGRTQEFFFGPAEPPLSLSLEPALSYNGLAPQTDPWSKTSYASDHVYKPVIVETEGRKHPIVYNPGTTTEAFITKTETAVQQQVHLPFTTEYKHSSHTKVESLIHNGYVEHNMYHSSRPVHDRPLKVENFFTKEQTEGSQPKTFGMFGPSYWRQSPNSTGYHGSGNTGYGDYNDKSTKDWPKPTGNSIPNRNPNSTCYHEPDNTSYGFYNDNSSKDWPKPSGNTIRNRNPNSTGYHEPDNTGYVDYNDKSSWVWPKPSVNTIRNGNPNSTGYHGPDNTGYEDYNDKSSNDWPNPRGNTIRNENPNSTGYHESDNTGYDGDYNDKSSWVWPKPSGNTIRNGNPNSTGYHRPDNTDYEDYNDKSSNDWPKHSGNTILNGNNDGNYHNQINDSKMEPTMVTSGGWARPSRTGWAAPPDTSLSRPTNDIGTATEFLKGASKTTSVTPSPHPTYTVPIKTGHKNDGYGETIDSREAVRRYKGAIVQM